MLRQRGLHRARTAYPGSLSGHSVPQWRSLLYRVGGLDPHRLLALSTGLIYRAPTGHGACLTYLVANTIPLVRHLKDPVEMVRYFVNEINQRGFTYLRPELSG